MYHKLESYKPYLYDHNINSSKLAEEKSNFNCQIFEICKVFRPKLNRFHIVLLSIILILLALNVQSFLYHLLYKEKMTEDIIQKYFLTRKFYNNLRVGKLIYKNPSEENLIINYNLNSSNQSTEFSIWSYQEFSNEYSNIVKVIFNVYAEKNIPFKKCPLIPDTLRGFLNTSLILEEANLTSLVEFYDSGSKTVQNKNPKSQQPEQYLNKAIDPKKTKEFWDLWNSNDISLLNVSKEYYGVYGTRLEPGGYWKPEKCISNFKIAIIIPYRDRLPHLKVLLYYLHLILQRQQLDYKIFVVEPNTPLNIRFNKGRVMNAAFLEALKVDNDINCFIFHDVDLVPEDDRILYSCPSYPRHLSVAIDKFDYILPYENLVGGVFAISKQHYLLVNGYSNNYWGWGAEDDDLSVRIKTNNLRIIRNNKNFSMFKMMRHRAQELNPNARKLLNTAKNRANKDGVNSIQYTVIKSYLYTGFTHILVDIGTLTKDEYFEEVREPLVMPMNLKFNEFELINAPLLRFLKDGSDIN